MTIGERIKNRREYLKLSVDEVAKKIDKDRATVYRYENDGIENMPITILEPLARVLQTTPAFLMGWNEVTTEISLSESEKQVLLAYRNNPSMQNAVNRLLGIESQVVKVYRAARSDNNAQDEILDVSADKIKKLREAKETDDKL